MIRLENLRKQYGSYRALDVPVLSITPGIHWVKGGNGSGKTTFFKTLAGLLPFEGDVWLNEINLRQHPLAFRRVVNYGEAEPLYPRFLTGQELMGLVAECKQAPPQQVQAVVEQLEIGPFIRQPTGTYSSGMLKKLSLAMAFVGQPKLILLDEPLITLDVATVDVVYQLVAAYRAQGVHFLISSHQAFEEGKLPFDSILLVENQTIRQLRAVSGQL